MNFSRRLAVAGLGLALISISPASAQEQPVTGSTDPVGDLVGASTQGAEAQAMPTGEASSARSDSATAHAAPPVKLPSPAMTLGSKLRFNLESTEERHGGGRDGVRNTRQAIELQILPRKGKSRVIRYVIRSGQVADDPLGTAMLNASRDLATDYEADATGKPLRLADWDGVRTAMLKHLIADNSAPVDGVRRVQALLGAMDAVTAIPFAVPETLMISDMQGWPELGAGRHDDPPAVAKVGGKEARLIGQRAAEPPDAGTCTVRLQRSTALDPASPAASGGKEVDSLDTTAEVSTVDGWVVRLTQTRTHKSGPVSEVRSWTLTREDPPACKG